MFPWDHQCVHHAGAVTYQNWIFNWVIFSIDGSGENFACTQKLFACPTPLGKGTGGRREDYKKHHYKAHNLISPA
jgi:hypothetical protein